MRSKESEKVESGQETRKKWRIRERERENCIENRR
jgi:hypothetical protein